MKIKTHILILGQILAIIGGILTNIALSHPDNIEFAISMELWGTFLILHFWVYVAYNKMPPKGGIRLSGVLARTSVAWVIFATLLQLSVWLNHDLIGNSIMNNFRYYYWGSFSIALLWLLLPLLRWFVALLNDAKSLDLVVKKLNQGK